tara:strand:- start:796 stop:1137 length:342 start_codon:yes stop_codon:yes gene_type:complete
MKYSILKYRKVCITWTILLSFFQSYWVVAEQVELKSHRSGVSEYVDFDDLDLTSLDGIFELRSRIKIAAKSTCQRLSDLSPLIFYGVAEMRDCNKRTIKSTNRHVEQLIRDAR